jgi:hypothetical protein
MTRRGASNQSVVRTAGRAAFLVSLLALGAGWSAANPVLFEAGPARQLSLLKPPLGDLRIQWSAQVHEEGGEFLVSRQDLRGSTSVVARVRPRVDGRYEVSQRGAAGSWIYKLRYRDRSGQEYQLATIRLNVESVDMGHGVVTRGGQAQPPAVIAAALLPAPLAGAAWLAAEQEVGQDSPRHWPPTPPP